MPALQSLITKDDGDIRYTLIHQLGESADKLTPDLVGITQDLSSASEDGLSRFQILRALVDISDRSSSYFLELTPEFISAAKRLMPEKANGHARGLILLGLALMPRESEHLFVPNDFL